MRKIVLPNRQRDRVITPEILLRRIAADTRTPYPILRRHISRIPDHQLRQAWPKLSHHECDKVWAIFRSGGQR
jgi:hypothetical protein